MVVEPRERPLVILPYSSMTAVESTSVVSDFIADCCESFEIFGSLWEQLHHLARIGSDEPALGPPQPQKQSILKKSVVLTGHAKLNRLMA